MGRKKVAYSALGPDRKKKLRTDAKKALEKCSRGEPLLLLKDLLQSSWAAPTVKVTK